jgi:hypothetical protein
MKNKLILPIILVGILAIAVIVALSITGTKKTQVAFLQKYGLSGLDTMAIVHQLDSRGDEPKELFSSITGKGLTLKDGKTTLELALPKDKFYLSFAPYENTTHPCTMHSPASCRGELVNVPVHATITDEKGAVLLDENVQTMDNGFVGVWLPKDINANIQVAYNGKTATAPISTFATSDTCLTTPLKLN